MEFDKKNQFSVDGSINCCTCAFCVLDLNGCLYCCKNKQNVSAYWRCDGALLSIRYKNTYNNETDKD